MFVKAISSQSNATPFTSKVIVTPNTAMRLVDLKQDNPPFAKSILEGLKILQKNGNKDIVMLERTHASSDDIVLWVYEKIGRKFFRSEMSQPIDFSLYTFKANIEQCYNKAKKNMVPVSSIDQKSFESFHPLK